METKSNIQWNELMPLEDSVVMCGVYNTETSEKTYKNSTSHA